MKLTVCRISDFVAQDQINTFGILWSCKYELCVEKNNIFKKAKFLSRCLPLDERKSSRYSSMIIGTAWSWRCAGSQWFQCPKSNECVWSTLIQWILLCIIIKINDFGVDKAKTFSGSTYPKGISSKFEYRSTGPELLVGTYVQVSSITNVISSHTIQVATCHVADCVFGVAESSVRSHQHLLI